MKLTFRTAWVLATALALGLAAGCGQKGPLYFPGEKPPPRTSAKPAPDTNKDADEKRRAP